LIRRWTRPTLATRLAALAATLTTLGTAGFLASVYPSLPAGLPVRYVLEQPYIYQRKSPMVVMLPAVVQTALLTIFGAIVLLLLWRASPAAQDQEGRTSAERAGMGVAAEGIALLAAIWITVQAVGAGRLVALWRGGWFFFGELYTFAIITGIVASVMVMARTMHLVGRHRITRAVDDPSMWRLRQLYFNPADPSLFVPTRTGAGWTLNFGRPLAILLLAVTLLIGIGGPFVLARYVLRGFAL
jgi:uncharacterized membrane protein